MKTKFWKIIATGLLTACFAATSFFPMGALAPAVNAGAVAQETYETLQYGNPSVLPNGSAKVVLTAQRYELAQKDHIENDDWDWDTMASRYEVMEREGNPSMFLWPVGGFHSSFNQWHRPNWQPASITGGEGFMMFVDFTRLLDATGLRLGIRIDTSADGNQGDHTKLTKGYIAANSSCAYYDYLNGNWVQIMTTADNRIPLPDHFAGYVYAPATSFPAVSEDGKFTGFMQMYHLDFTAGSTHENVNPIVFDDLEIVKSSTAAHTHDYALAKTVAPTCTKGGEEIWACACGQTKWQGLTPALGHAAGQKHFVANGLSATLCATCGELEYFAEDATALWENPVTVTYNYLWGDTAPITRTYPAGYVLSVRDVPWIFDFRVRHDGYDDIYQFFRWAADDKNVDGLDPVGLAVTESTQLYAHYNFISYNQQKYRAMQSDVSFNGGPYATARNEGKGIFIGASNFSLWHDLEGWYRTKGIPVLNNSIAGCTNHNAEEYLDELILMYKPAFVVSGITFNDQNYHSMTDKMILQYIRSRIERIHDACEDTQIFFVSPNTLPGRPEDLSAGERVAQKTREMCDEYDFATYIDLHDIVSQYYDQYPEGWDTWTHMHQPHLAHMFGDMVLPYVQERMQAGGVVFTPDQLIPFDPYENMTK